MKRNPINLEFIINTLKWNKEMNLIDIQKKLNKVFNLFNLFNDF